MACTVFFLGSLQLVFPASDSACLLESDWQDPYLGYVLAQPVVRGIQSKGVLANAKHWVLNSQEQDRQGDDALVDERTRFEIYYPPFEGAIEAGVASMMCSFNRINGIWSCGDPDTLRVDLKERLGFQGFVMSDWGACHSTSIGAGLDMEMPGGHGGCPKYTVCPGAPHFGPANPADGQCPKGVPSCIDGNVSTKVVDEAVLRIMTPMFEFDLFKNAAQWSNLTKRSLTVTSAAHSLLARQIAAAATVLLRNEHEALPIPSSVRSIVVFGEQAATPSVHGGGSGAVLPAYIISPLQGICEKANASGVACTYEPGDDLEKAAAAAASADLAIVVVGDSSSEGHDRVSLSFSGAQDALVTAVAGHAKHGTVVVGLNPGPVLLPWAEQVEGLLLMFQPGLECGHSLADVLWGAVNPSAKLPLTMPATENQIGMTVDQYPGTPNETLGYLTSNYTERLLVGYRWYDAHEAQPRYEFGFGKSYTTFAYSALVTSCSAVSFTVKNTGSRAGAEVAQLYLSFPAAAGEPPQQLKGFKKVQLDPGVAKQVVLNLTSRAFSIWSVEEHAWTPMSGRFGVSVGSSSRDSRLNGTIDYPQPDGM